MKKNLVLVALIALGLPAAAQGNASPGGYTPTPVSPLAQRALDACPGLMARTESAVANGHISYAYDNDCDCIARSIDFSTWVEASASYSGPRMPDSDAYIIIGALSSAATIDAALSEIDSNLSGTGYSATSACYDK